jgi:hypothetical protein
VTTLRNSDEFCAGLSSLKGPGQPKRAAVFALAVVELSPLKRSWMLLLPVTTVEEFESRATARTWYASGGAKLAG